MLLLVVIAATVGLKLRSTLTATVAETDQARNQLLAGAHLLKTSGLGLTKEEAAQATADFSGAEAHFTHVHQSLTGSRLIGVFGGLPFSSPQVKAATDLSEIGIHASRSGQILVGVIASALPPAPAKATAISPSEKALSILAALDPKLPELTAELNQIAAIRARIPSKGLLPQLSNAVAQFDKKLDLATIQTAITTLRADEAALRGLLGADGARSYLVLNQDPAELRATGGFIGSVGFLNFDKGKMAPFVPVDIYSIDWNSLGQSWLGPPGTKTHVDLPPPIREAFPTVASLELRDSNWSPDFPTSAKQAESLLEKETRLQGHVQQVHGVIALDPYFIASLLKITGPVTVPETGQEVRADNFFATTLLNVQLNQTTTHKSFLSQAAKAILPKVLALPASRYPELLQAVGAGCEDRSLQAYFDDAAVEKLVADHHCSGAVLPLTGDGAMVVVSNLGGNKDDFYLNRNYALDIAMNADGSARHTLRVHFYGLTHVHPLLTAYLPYQGWLRVLLPPSSRVVSTAGATLGPVAANADPDAIPDRTVLHGWFKVDFNGTTDITIVYDVSAADLKVRNDQLHFLWQKQAGRPLDAITVAFTPPPGSNLRGVQGGTVQYGMVTTDLSVDRELIFDYRP